jgi:methylated-DNA-protein-cysteine methyltransferase related protein
MFCISESKLPRFFAGCLLVKRRSQSKSEKSKLRNILEDKRARVVRCIRGLPAGMVSSYGAVAKAAGWAGAARQVVRILQQVPGLPWHRVVGSGGAIKLCGENAAEQRFRLRMEGVTFRGARVDMKRHEFRFKTLRH